MENKFDVYVIAIPANSASFDAIAEMVLELDNAAVDLDEETAIRLVNEMARLSRMAQR